MEEKPNQLPIKPLIRDEDGRDPALHSLADAMRVSFRVLSVIMILFVLLFLATGFQSIESQEEGIVKVFGKTVGVAKPGFTYNWPFPIGEIQKVSTADREIEIDRFWMEETAKDKLEDTLAKRSRGDGGLRPGWDGYLLTADRNLVHIRFICRYRVDDVITYTTTVQNGDAFLETILCNAAIEAAATRTSDAILVDARPFLLEVKDRAQAKIDIVMGITPGSPQGIRIHSVELKNKIWPLAAYSAYENAQRAKAEKQTAINKAVSQARTLTQVVGEAQFRQLAGEPWNDPAIELQRAQAGTFEDEPYNLIGHFSYLEDRLAVASLPSAARTKLQAQAQVVRETIDTILVRATTGGEVRKIIANAEATKTRTIQNAEQRAKRFRELLVHYKKAPTVFLEKTWADVLDEVLQGPTVEKIYISPGQKGMILHLNQDPRIASELRNYYRKQQINSPNK